MIDHNKPDDDPVVTEARGRREAFAAEHGYDVRVQLQRREATSGRPYSDLQPRTPLR